MSSLENLTRTIPGNCRLLRGLLVFSAGYVFSKGIDASGAYLMMQDLIHMKGDIHVCSGKPLIVYSTLPNRMAAIGEPHDRDILPSAVMAAGVRQSTVSNESIHATLCAIGSKRRGRSENR
jgi:hypothetical protein